MAVATHASRVAKEYAPFGYSIKADTSTLLPATVAADSSYGVGYWDDVDVYIERVSLVAASGLADGTNHFDVRIGYADNDGVLGNPVIISSTVNTAAMVNNKFNDIGITAPVVPAGKILFAQFFNEANSGSVVAPYVNTRYRRQA